MTIKDLEFDFVDYKAKDGTLKRMYKDEFVKLRTDYENKSEKLIEFLEIMKGIK